MVELIHKRRKPPILTPSSIPCLSRLPTINITQGCALGCTYCYIQGYSNYPGADRVVLYENTAEIVEAELSRKRVKPRRVYFSPSSDAFQPVPEIEEVSFRTMQVLLEAGVEVAFLTKGLVTDRFLKLFAARPRLVFAQVGITTRNRDLWATFEPGTAAPAERIEAIASLTKIGVVTTARLDPLIPDLTDTEENLVPLLQDLWNQGIRKAAASYLFLRPEFAARVTAQIERLRHSPCLPGTRHSADGDVCGNLDRGARAGPSAPPPAAWSYQPFRDGCAGGRTLDAVERAGRLLRLSALGERIGVRIAPCRCKNPELGGDGCAIAGPTSNA